MTVTLTIKQVPEPLARQLKRRAERNRRSLQKEMLSIMEDAAGRGVPPAPAAYSNVSEPAAVYSAKRTAIRRTGKTVGGEHAGKLTLDQLWQRARKLGASMPSESAAIIRRDRDARHR